MVVKDIEREDIEFIRWGCWFGRSWASSTSMAHAFRLSSNAHAMLRHLLSHTHTHTLTHTPHTLPLPPQPCSKTLGCSPIAHVDHMRADKLASAGLVEEVPVGSGRVVKVTGIEARGATATVLLRGSNSLVLEEAERSLHDALCVVRCLVQKRFLIAGGGSPEIELAVKLGQWAKTLVVSKGFGGIGVVVGG